MNESRGGQVNYRAGAAFLQEKAKTIGIVQTGMEKALGQPNCSFSVTEGAYRKKAENLFTRAWPRQETMATN